MCGIAGLLDWSGADQGGVVTAMVERLRHRGPDARRVARFGPATLGHARLSVIDTSPAAHQPMQDGEGRAAIVFNGEIYNYRELRAELERRGARFRTASDTEVILEAYKAWGTDCLSRLNGMFAFALWDPHRRALLLARDRLGKKPLFHAALGDGLVFASELSALRRHPGLSSRLDPAALHQYLSMGYVLGGDCILAGVDKLPPGGFLLATSTGCHHGRYWSLAPHFHTKSRWRSEDEAVEALDALIDDAVRARLVSDVPLGAFLSGGIDSSTIVAAMTRHGAPDQVQTFSIGFPQPSYNEAPQARRVAAHLGVSHHQQEVSGDSLTLLPLLMDHAGEPFADTSLIPTWHLSRFARERVTVCLSGDGGDEVFAGYETYAADRLHRLLRAVPAPLVGLAGAAVERFWPVSHGKVSFDYKLRHFLAARGLDFPRAHCSWRTLFNGAEIAALLQPDRRAALAAFDPFARIAPLFEEVAGCDPIDQACYVDIRSWMLDDILVKVDRASMAHGLEVRAPLLDHRVVEFAAALPVRYKLKGLGKKHILRRVCRRHLPAAVTAPRKLGFNAPVAPWLATAEGTALVEGFTASAAFAEWIAPEAVARLWREHRAGRADHSLKLYCLACLGAWLDGGAVADRPDLL